MKPMTVQQLHYPFTEAQIRPLQAGDSVALTGLLFTGRDRFHKYLYEGGVPPVDLRDGAIYHCGPVVAEEEGGWRVIAAGPTTSGREDPYMPEIIVRFGVRIVLGKGGMGAGTREACRRHGCVYLQAVGGAAVSLARRIRRVAGVHLLSEFGAAEAVWSFDVAGFEAIVAIDAHGRSLYDEVSAHSRLELDRILSGSSTRG